MRLPCVLMLLAIAIAFAGAGCGSDDGGGAKGRTGADPFTEVGSATSQARTARRAAPRWEHVARFEGIAPASHPVSIGSRAIQWRARWRCTTGRLAMNVVPKPRAAAERASGRCPGSGEATWVPTGNQQLRVTGGGRWSVVVEQQVDTPLNEPPLAAMRAPGARLLKTGSFYDVERQGAGRARLYRLANGRGALRLAPFRTSSNTDLFVWLSTATRPRTTREAVAARRLGRLIALKSTIGEQNYMLPRNVDPSEIRSIVIWCVPIQIVYSAAALS